MSNGHTLTPEIVAALKAHVCRESLLQFVRFSSPDYHIAPVHREITGRLEAFLADVMAKKRPKLAIFVPPRHGKSFIASERFPVWAMGHFPWLRFIVGSYGHDLSEDFSMRALDLMQGQYYRDIFPTVRLNNRRQRSGDWETTEGGGYFATGVGGAATGKGANIIVMDDTVKNYAEALSETRRQAVWEWYGTTLKTRLAPLSGELLIMTRWHQDDLGGRLLEKGGWQVIKYPAIADDGTALDPIRFPVDVLMERKDAMGEMAFRALFQQEPTAADGTEFKKAWFRFYRAGECPALDELLISVDAAFKGGDGSDPVSIQVWGRKGHDYYLVADQTEKIGFNDTIKALDGMIARFGRFSPTLLIEEKANGAAIIETMKNKYSRIIAVNPLGGKVARARSVAPLFEAGRVFLPDESLWLEKYMCELIEFPNGKHDDRVDATTQALARLEHGKGNTILWGENIY